MNHSCKDTSYLHCEFADSNKVDHTLASNFYFHFVFDDNMGDDIVLFCKSAMKIMGVFFGDNMVDHTPALLFGCYFKWSDNNCRTFIVFEDNG